MTKAELLDYVTRFDTRLDKLETLIRGVQIHSSQMTVHTIEHVNNEINNLRDDLNIARLKVIFPEQGENTQKSSSSNPKHKKGGNPWTTEDEDIITKLYATGKDAKEIAVVVERSEYSVLGRLHKLDKLNREDKSSWESIKASFDK